MTRTIPNIYHKRLFAWILSGAVLIALAAVRLQAVSQVDARLDTTQARIGDRLTLTLIAHSAAGETVQFPDLESSLDKFEVLAELPTERVEGESGSALTRNSYVLTSFDTGPLQIPQLPFTVMDSAGIVDTLWSSLIDVEILSLVQDTLNAELRPLRGLVDVPGLWKRFVLWGAAALVLLVLLVYLWRAYLKRRAKRLAASLKTTRPSRPAHLVALDELDRIKLLGLIEKGEIKLFHILISEAVRHYLDSRYAVDAPEMTTWELMAELEPRRDIDGEFKELIRVFLSACDLVKFAKFKPLIVEINSTFNQAYEIVEKSRPQIVSPSITEAGQPAAAVVRAGSVVGGEGQT
ncbi:hypothetical protein ACFL4X_00750 [Gemmatimonadota bacterium]